LTDVLRTAVTLACAAALAAPAVAATAAPDVETTHDLVAEAGFLSVDPSGCVATAVTVFAARTTLIRPPGRPTPSLPVNLTVTSYDACSDEVVLQADAYAEPAPDALTAGSGTRLAPARIHASLAGVDAVSGEPVHVSADVSFAAAGQLTREPDAFRVHEDGFVLNAHSLSLYQPAVAGGSVEVDGVEYVTGPSSFAYVLAAKSGSVTIQR
jgi:hypothetical protein